METDAYAPIEVLGWKIFLEQPLSEAFAPLIGSVLRAGLVLLLGIGLAIAASRMLARQMVAPIRTLEAGVARLAAGRLDEPVVVQTGDELEGLADEFNLLARQLKESYASLEQKIEVRTHQLSEANSAKSRFLASASHDLRQPVHALGLFVAQLDEAKDPVARQHIAEKIAASSTAVSELLEALLDVSKLDTDAALPRHVDLALQPMFDRLEHSFAVTAHAKGLRLRVRPTPACVTSDPVFLERILLNLLSNAIAYTRSGGVLIGARCHGDFVAIEVWDTGVGIAPDEHRHIFEEFYRLPGAAGEDGKGLGLGLAIVERLARRLQVTVGLTSIAGRGSKFSVIVPRASGAAVEVQPPELTAQPIRLQGMRVALIDDDDTARDAAQGLLTQWGCSVVASASGQQYLRALDEGASSPALIICDYRLGESELGTDVIALIRERLRADIPAVIVSGDVTPTLREDAASSGLHLLYKPLKAAKLRALLHHVYVSADAP